MTFAITNSGTHAGWKKPMGNATPWTCACLETHPSSAIDMWPKAQPAYLVRCNDCGTRRP